jgi:predicted nucleotidyltransferase
MTAAEIAAALSRVFQSEAGVIAAYLYGSHADGCAHRDSDVDVAVLLDRAAYPTDRERFDARLRLIAELSAALGSNQVDLIVLNDVPATLARHVLWEGLRVHCRDAEALHTFSRTVYLLAPDLERFLQRQRRRLLDSMPS